MSLIFHSFTARLVLSTGSSNSTVVNNETLIYCGVNFCSRTATANVTTSDDMLLHPISVDKPSKADIELLTGILLGFALLATLIIIVLVDSLTV